MELINWNLSAIDTFFSQSEATEEVVFPDGIFTARFAMDVVCLAVLSVGDIKDIYLFGLLITGYLLIGWTALDYRKFGKTAVFNRTTLLSIEINKHFGAGSDRVMELHRKVTHNVDCYVRPGSSLWRRTIDGLYFWDEKG